ncbi:sulfite oxidase [Nannochloropsis gaditana]|uniref:Sulfite oxidase n=1 Tax=Nannochloropsis gaditana TaxID=72520 RepID=W7TK48_9STRA|nr:sulfite oxidase [Nannochloropsis gaditana]
MLRHAVVRFPAAFKRINVIRGGCLAQCSPCRSLEIHRHSHARVMTSAAAALSSSFQDKRDTGNTRAVVLLALSLIAGVGGIRTASPAQTEAGATDAGVKEIEYTKADVKAHKTIETGVWVTYKDGVYDITKFAENHPGGNKILMAAGGPVEPYWNLYAVHKDPEVQETIKEILGELRIGTLKHSPEDEKEVDLDDPYAHEPERHPAFKINTLKPFNAEPPGALLVDRRGLLARG